MSRRVRVAALLVLLGLALAVWPVSVAAQGFDKVGDEVPVGKNATGENCRVRLTRIIKEPIDYHVYQVYCEGWTASSGEITRFRVREATPEKLLTDSPWQKRYEQKLIDCGAVEPTEMLGVKTAGLRACRREDSRLAGGGWPSPRWRS